jgi:hypothetical protein
MIKREFEMNKTRKLVVVAIIVTIIAVASFSIFTSF